jgi:intein/homing endonuclease
MARLNSQQQEVVHRCQVSMAWWLRNFGRVKHPSAGILPFTPFSYQRNAIKSFRKFRLNIFRKCLAKGTMVWTPLGPRAIETIREGDNVYSYDDKSGAVAIGVVKAAWENGDRPTVIVRTKTGHRTVCTPDHRFLTRRGWIQAVDLTPNDILVEVHEPARYNAASDSEAIILGYLVTDGQVKSVLPGVVCPVYDLEIEKYHNFIADGAVVHNCRQAGVSKIAGAFALWFAMFQPHKTILIISRTDMDAMKFLADHIVFLFTHLPAWMQELWKPVKKNDHEIVFPNGSRIQSLTSHPDVLRSNASSLNIIDEAAFIQSMDVMWAGGWPCQTGNTLIATEDGLIPIKDIANSQGDEWQDINIGVMTDEGIKTSDKYHIAGLAPTVVITTELGYWNEGTGHHRLRTINKDGDYVWKQLSEFEPGDIIVSIPGQFAGKRQILSNGYSLTPVLAEIIGLYVADGSISRTRPKRLRIVFDPQDVAVRDLTIDSLNSILTTMRIPTKAYAEVGNGTVDLRLNSAPFVQMFIDNGLCKTNAGDARIPAIILRSDAGVLTAFLRGLFDADGWCYQSATSLKLGMATKSEELAKQVQTVLHSLGIIAKRLWVISTDGRFGADGIWQVQIYDAESKRRFIDQIGFMSPRKRAVAAAFASAKCNAIIDHPVLVLEFINEFRTVLLMREKSPRRTALLANISMWKCKERVPYKTASGLSAEFGLKNRLSTYLSKGFYFDKVKKTAACRSEVYDLSVPDNNTYLANGMVSHNTLQHGGNVIVISTTNGVGNWYWSTMTDAEAGVNQFNPVLINWWDMDWVIEYTDPLSREERRIAPRDNLVECKGQTFNSRFGEVRLDTVRYGPYWSPWLEEQYRALQEQGEAWKFEQEVLAEFVGSGNTVLSKDVLAYIQTTIKEPVYKVKGLQTYVHPVTGATEEIDFDFRDPQEGLWVWEKPILAKPIKKRGNTIIDPGQPAHAYVMGVDLATGKGKDYSGIEIFDIVTREQVAEFMAHCLPRELVKYIDRIGRWYNCALAVVERNNGGDTLIDSLRHDVMYPRVWRKKDINDKPRPMHSKLKQRPMKVSPYGFSTSAASKPTLNKFLLDFIRTNDEGYAIFSKRLLKQFQTYVRKRDRAGRDTMKTEAEDGAGNFDDSGHGLRSGPYRHGRCLHG